MPCFRRRHCEERSDEAIHSFFAWRDGLLRCARNDGAGIEHTSAFSRRVSPEVCKNPSPRKIRGRRECRVLAAPAVSCAIVRRKTHTSIQEQPEHSGIPCAVVLRLMPCSPRRRIPLASVAAGLKARRIPVGLRKTSGGLTPATGARTTRFCRPQQCFRLARCVRSRKHPPCKHLARPALPRPPHPAPYVRDDRDTPLWWDGMAGILLLICPTG